MAWDQGACYKSALPVANCTPRATLKCSGPGGVRVPNGSVVGAYRVEVCKVLSAYTPGVQLGFMEREWFQTWLIPGDHCSGLRTYSLCSPTGVPGTSECVFSLAVGLGDGPCTDKPYCAVRVLRCHQ